MAAMGEMVDGWKCYLFWVPWEKMRWVNGKPQLSDNFLLLLSWRWLGRRGKILILLLRGGEATFPWSIWLILSQPKFSSAAGTKMSILRMTECYFLLKWKIVVLTNDVAVFTISIRRFLPLYGWPISSSRYIAVRRSPSLSPCGFSVVRHRSVYLSLCPSS